MIKDVGDLALIDNCTAEIPDAASQRTSGAKAISCTGSIPKLDLDPTGIVRKCSNVLSKRLAPL